MNNLEFYYNEDNDALYVEGVKYPSKFFREIKKGKTDYQFALNSDHTEIMLKDSSNRGIVVSDKEHYQFIYPNGINTKRIIVIPNRTVDQPKAYYLELLWNSLPTLSKSTIAVIYKILCWLYFATEKVRRLTYKVSIRWDDNTLILSVKPLKENKNGKM